MKLGYKITQEPITVGLKNPNYVVSETLDLSVYTDISSIVNWFAADVLDWARRRQQIKPLFYAAAGNDLSNFGSLTPEEQMIGAECFFIPYAMRLNFWSDNEDENKWRELLSNTKLSRSSTIEAMRKAIGDKIRIGVLTLNETQIFDKDTTTMISWYERSDARDFYQWLTNEVGSPYETNGFENKPYFSTSLRSELINIYNGAY